MHHSTTHSANAHSTKPSTAPARERRQQPRSKEDRPAWLHRGSSSDGVQMIDLSNGGACFITLRSMSIGKPVKLQVGHGRTQAVIEGVVVRQLERPDGTFEIGLRVNHLGGFELSRRFPTRARVIA